MSQVCDSRSSCVAIIDRHSSLVTCQLSIGEHVCVAVKGGSDRRNCVAERPLWELGETVSRVEAMGSMSKSDLIEDLRSAYGEVLELCSQLRAEQFLLPTECPGWDVKDQIAHLYGTEAQMLGREVPPLREGVLRPEVRGSIAEKNAAWVESMRPHEASVVVEAFRDVVGERLAQLGEMSEAEFEKVGWTPKGEAPYATFLAVRIFDIWMHNQDIREATDHLGDLETRSADRAFDEVRAALGYVVGKLMGAPEGTVVRIELSGGPARAATTEISVIGGRAQLTTDRPSERPTVVLRCDFRTFMRCIGGRWSPLVTLDGGAITLNGDAALGRGFVSVMDYVP